MLLPWKTYVRRATMLPAIVALLAVLPHAASAQTVVDARFTEFMASPDHDGVLADGSPRLSAYSLDIYRVSTGALSTSVDLGKPAPLADGTISVDFVARLSSPLPPGVEYQARVTAIGPGGTTSSDFSNTFVFSAPCAPALSSISASFGAAAASGSANVAAGADCAWSATTATSWLTITAGASGAGNGTVTFAVAANSGAARSGTLTIAGQTFTVSQAAAACSYSISPTSRSLGASAQSTSVSVSTTNGCAWTSASQSAWLTISAGLSGTGDGTVTIAVAANPVTTQRIGTVLIAGRTFTVTQSAASCSYTVTPTSQNVGASAISGSFTVTATAGCSWTASGMPAWITMSGAARTGSGTLPYTIAANPAGQRTATLTIAGISVTVKQSPGGPPLRPGNLRIGSQ
jgi:hypothetical protein